MQSADQSTPVSDTAVPPPHPVAAHDPRATVARSTYRREQFSNLSPVEVVQKLYDVAILGCKKNDVMLAQKAITELMVSLNFEQKELALDLYQLYDYCKRSIRQGNTEQAVGVLEELRATWSEAFGLGSHLSGKGR